MITCNWCKHLGDGGGVYGPVQIGVNYEDASSNILSDRYEGVWHVQFPEKKR